MGALKNGARAACTPFAAARTAHLELGLGHGAVPLEGEEVEGVPDAVLHAVQQVGHGDALAVALDAAETHWVLAVFLA